MSNTLDLGRELRRYELGVRTALEELVRGNDYARVEDILRSLLRDERPVRRTDISFIGKVDP
jgi:hypothetical protein